MVNELYEFYMRREEPVKGAMLALRDIVLGFDEEIEEAYKWSLPYFFLRGKGFCYLWMDKKTGWPYLAFMKGKDMEHSMLEAGNRTLVKVFPMDPSKDLPLEAIEECLEMARALYD